MTLGGQVGAERPDRTPRSGDRRGARRRPAPHAPPPNLDTPAITTKVLGKLGIVEI